MHLLVRSSLIMALVTLAATRVAAASDDDAIAVVARLHSALLAVAAEQPAPSLGQRYEELAPVIRDTHDLATMGRLTVRRFWRQWGEDQRDAFSDAFERLSITTYASRFAGVGPDTFAILGGSASGEGLYDVDAVIRRVDADDVPMRYQLRLENAQWRIINVFADGVSELSLMGSEYFDILEAGAFEDLIAELESQIAEL